MGSSKKQRKASRRAPSASRTPARKAPKRESPWDRECNQFVPPKLPLNVGELRHGDGPRWDRFKLDFQQIGRFGSAYSEVLQRMRTAQLPDPVGSTYVWCFVHDTDRPHTLDLRGWGGAPKPCPALTTWVGAKDQPGEAAVHPNEARRHEVDMAKDLDQLHTLVERIRYRSLVYLARSPNDADRLAVEKANRRDEPGCVCCRNAGHWVEPFTKSPSTVKGTLEEPLLLCLWCWRFVERFGRVPTASELAQHHDPSVHHVDVQTAPGETTRMRK